MRKGKYLSSGKYGIINIKLLTHDMREWAFDTREGAFEICEMKGLQTGEGDIGQHLKNDDMLHDLSVRLEKGNHGLCCCRNRGYFLHLFLLKESSMHVNGEGGEYLLIEISCREIGWFVRCGVAEAGDCCLRRRDDLL
jgi:hypothetical protein